MGVNTVVLTKGTDPILNNKPVNLAGGTQTVDRVTVMSTLLVIVVTFEDGAAVLYDGGTKLIISLPSCYKDKVDGLCGKYTDKAQVGSDLSAPDSSASTWKVDPTCPDSLPLADPCLKHPEREAWASASCSIIKSGPIFEECRKKLNWESFYQECKSSSCNCDSGGDCECMCTAVAVFASACAKEGVCVDWRSNHFCPVMCNNDQDYAACLNPANTTCRDNTEALANNRDLVVEGCFCESGKVTDYEGKCVSKNQCPCEYDGQLYPSGSVMDIRCQNCKCSDGKFNCTGKICECEFSCDNGEKCLNKTQVCDGKQDCRDFTDECVATCKHRDEINVCNSIKINVYLMTLISSYYKTGGNCTEFLCDEEFCLDHNFVCDGEVDCLDGSDEQKCPTISNHLYLNCI